MGKQSSDTMADGTPKKIVVVLWTQWWHSPSQSRKSMFGKSIY